ncbi:MAG TPA: hypothetical protein VFV75_01595 [Candidatus Polarisedimenticolaceae bacterium]|nr:hypothetical protein [Candidatus Polarisedimenticolaceae bacterium]
MRQILGACCFALLSVTALRAAPAHLVADTDPSLVYGSTAVKETAEGTDVIFFLAYRQSPFSSGGGPIDLWRCDRDGQHPVLLRPGFVEASDMLVLGDRLFFKGNEEVHGGEPWTSDGTPEGTRLIADIVPGAGGSHPIWFVALQDTVYFISHVDSRWWKTDAAGSSVEPVHAVPSPDGHASRPSGIVIRSGDSLFGWFDDGVHGLEPWRTDGTAAGSHLLADIAPGAASSFRGDGVDLDGTVVFAAADGSGAPSLWSAGPGMQVRRIATVQSGPLRRAGSRIYFHGTDAEHGSEPWQTDGTPEGTGLVADLVPGAGSSQAENFRAAGPTVFFFNYEPGTGLEPWRVLPEGGAALLKDVAPGPASSIPNPTPFSAVLGEALLFRADDGVHGAELWRSDGTPEGTVLLEDVAPGPASGVSSASAFRVRGNVLLFAGDGGTMGVEPWRSDGTAEGTRLMGDLNPFVGTASGRVRHLIAAARGVYFAANPNTVWHTDGMVAGTHSVGTFAVESFAAAGDRLLFMGSDAARGSELWATDPTGSTAGPVADLLPGPQSSGGYLCGSVGPRALAMGLSTDGVGLWSSDGTQGGTVPLGSFRTAYAAAPGEDPRFLALDDGIHGVEPWVTDGTLEGTHLVADLVPGPDTLEPYVYIRAGDATYFWSFYGGPPYLWRTDGTAGGTHPVAGFDGGGPLETSLTAVGDRIFFVEMRWPTVDVPPTFGVWKADGSGASLVAVLMHPPVAWAGTGDLFFFVVRREPTDPAGPSELWRSDGTAAGTSFLRTFPHRIAPSFLGQADGVVFLSAGEGSGPFPGPHALWRSDGTIEGTRKVQDLAAGPLVRFGKDLYFPGDDGVTGVELWAGRASILAGNASLALEELGEEVAGAGLPAGIATSLRAKLKEHGLQAFLRALDAQDGKQVPSSKAAALRAFATEILELLETHSRMATSK